MGHGVEIEHLLSGHEEGVLLGFLWGFFVVWVFCFGFVVVFFVCLGFCVLGFFSWFCWLFLVEFFLAIVFTLTTRLWKTFSVGGTR